MQANLRLGVLKKLGIDPATVEIDLFASLDDTQDKLFCSEENSAWYYDWGKLCGKGMYLWANPPFEDMKKVITKACLEPCKLILVSPVWQNANWKRLLDRVTVSWHEVPPFVPGFERTGRGGCCQICTGVWL